VNLTQVELVNAPVVEVLLEGDDATLLSQVQLPRPVEVDDGPEAARVPVKVVLVVLHWGIKIFYYVGRLNILFWGEIVK
jgi:hypothetical protein